MTDFLNSVKADLLDRRLLPLVALVLAALVAALAYVVLGGGSSAATAPAALATAPAPVSSGVTVTQTTPESAVAEVSSGGSAQHRGVAHNPFTPLSEAALKPSKSAAGAAATGSSTAPAGAAGVSTSGVKASSPSSGEPASTTPSTPSKPSKSSKPSKPSKQKRVYHVATLFGALPDASTPLTPYENLKLLTPLPSAARPLIVFRGVTAGGKSATFTLVGEAILHGKAACLPSASQCEAIDLKAGQSEQLEYLPPSGQTLVYELTVVSIVSSKASGAGVKSVLREQSKAGRALLGHDGLAAIPYLHYSAAAGVLVFAGHGAFAAHAHTSAYGRHRR